MRSFFERKRAPSAAAALRLGAAACALAGGCHRVLDLDEVQCRRDDDCAARGLEAGASCVNERCRPPQAPADETWGCLGRVEIPSPTGAMVPFELQVRDAASNTALGAAGVRLCGRLDSTCATPSMPLTTDAAGNAAWTVADNFDGYVEIERADYVKSLYYPQVSYFRRGGGRGPYVSIATPATLEGLATLNNIELDPLVGNTLLYVIDCRGRPAAGVRFESDAARPNTKEFYLVNRVPDASATVTDAVLGGGGFINTPPGLVTVTAVVAESGRRIGSTSLIVRRGQVTYAVLEPAP